MKRPINSGILVLLAVLIAVPSFARKDNENKLYNEGKKALAKRNYEEAARVFTALAEKVQDKPEYDFLAGLSYLYSSADRTQSLPYFEAAVSKFSTDTIAETYFYYGEAQSLVGDYAGAIESWETFRQFIVKKKKTGQEILKQVDHLIACAQFAEDNKAIVNKEHVVKNLVSLNTEFPEYAPVISPDKLAMIFTSRRDNTTGGKKAADNQFFEDILVATLNGENWEVTDDAGTIKSYLFEDHNSNKMDAGVYYGPEGDKLYIYRKTKIYESKQDDQGIWQDPEAIENIHKGRKHTPSVTLTKDGMTMIFSTKGKDGQGGRDLYMTTKKSDGTWSDPASLGGEINTSGDEDAPFLAADGKTLYFASNGQVGFGGFDIFTTTMNEDGSWTMPVNMGQPLNSSSDDIYLILEEDEESGYFASSRLGGKGGMDIYAVQLVTPAMDVNITGVAWYDDRKVAADDVEVVITDSETGDEVARFKPEAGTGRYNVTLPSDASYDVEVIQKDTEPFKNGLNIPKVTQSFESFQVIGMNSVLNDNGQETAKTLQIRSGFFDMNQAAPSNVPEDSTLAFLGGGAKEARYIAHFDDPSFSPDEESFIVINDTLAMGYLTSVDNVRKYFGYNENKLDAADDTVTGFVDYLATRMKQSPSLTVRIDASASKVPTETFGSNEELAEARVTETKKIILDLLSTRNIDGSSLKWDTNSEVSGPAYDPGKANALTVYKRYQYVNISIVEPE